MINRRTAMGLAAGGLGLAADSPGLSATRSYDLDQANTRMDAFLRTLCRLDGRKTFLLYRGTIYGKPEGRAAEPLFNIEGFSWSRLTRLDETTYRNDSIEAGYFLDLVTGKPVDDWTNPLNGLATRVKHYRSYAHMRITPDGIEPIQDGPPAPGVRYVSTGGMPTVMGDKVWMRQDLIGEFANRPKASFADPLEYSGPVSVATSLATWMADLADLADRRKTFVPATMAYQSMGSWRPFMRMGLTPGMISWRLMGVKQASIDGIPKYLRDRVMNDYPDFLTREKAEAPKA